MNALWKIFTILVFASFLFSCGKHEVSTLDGTYTGTFTVTYKDSTLTGPTTVTLHNGQFACLGNSNKIPAGGSGTFSFENNTLNFNDINIWTANFDWNLILSGKYYYTINGKKLTISADKNGEGNYQYELEKQ